MPVSDPYVTADEYRAGISPNKVDSGANLEVDKDLLAVQRFLERELDRFFTKDDAPVARDFFAPAGGPVYPEAENPYKYAGKYSRTLHLDADLVSVSELLTDDNGAGTPTILWAPTDFLLLPLNNDKGPEPRPFSALYIPQQSTKLGWPSARLVRVTGIWGWPAVPMPIKRGVIQLTAILRLESPRAQSTTTPEGIMMSMTKEGRGIVDDLTRVYGRPSF